MADFKTVIEEYRRMCASTTCVNCVFGKLDNECDDIFDEMEPENIELAVMAWSKNHPKKVYPTWAEWLEKQGIITNDRFLYNGKHVAVTEQSAYKPIPDDIAEKLGIKPKNERK